MPTSSQHSPQDSEIMEDTDARLHTNLDILFKEPKIDVASAIVKYINNRCGQVMAVAKTERPWDLCRTIRCMACGEVFFNITDFDQCDPQTRPRISTRAIQAYLDHMGAENLDEESFLAHHITIVSAEAAGSELAAWQDDYF